MKARKKRDESMQHQFVKIIIKQQTSMPKPKLHKVAKLRTIFSYNMADR